MSAPKWKTGRVHFALHTRPAVDGPCPGIVPRWRQHRTPGPTPSSIRPFGGATPRSLMRALRTADYPRTSGQGEQLNFMLRPPPPGFPGHPFAARPPEPARRNHGQSVAKPDQTGCFPQTEPFGSGSAQGAGVSPRRTIPREMLSYPARWFRTSTLYSVRQASPIKQTPTIDCVRSRPARARRRL